MLVYRANPLRYVCDMKWTRFFNILYIREIRVKYIDKNWIFYQSVNLPLMFKKQNKNLSSKVII